MQFVDSCHRLCTTMSSNSSAKVKGGRTTLGNSRWELSAQGSTLYLADSGLCHQRLFTKKCENHPNKQIHAGNCPYEWDRCVSLRDCYDGNGASSVPPALSRGKGLRHPRVCALPRDTVPVPDVRHVVSRLGLWPCSSGPPREIKDKRSLE